MLRQYAGGEWTGEGGTNEVCWHPFTFIHTAVPLHALSREPGQVSWFQILPMLKMLSCFQTHKNKFSFLPFWLFHLTCVLCVISLSLSSHWHLWCSASFFFPSPFLYFLSSKGQGLWHIFRIMSLISFLLIYFKIAICYWMADYCWSADLELGNEGEITIIWAREWHN